MGAQLEPHHLDHQLLHSSQQFQPLPCRYRDGSDSEPPDGGHEKEEAEQVGALLMLVLVHSRCAASTEGMKRRSIPCTSYPKFLDPLPPPEAEETAPKVNRSIQRCVIPFSLTQPPALYLQQPTCCLILHSLCQRRHALYVLLS